MFWKDEARREAAAQREIERFEALAKADPERYRRLVVLTAAAGYAAPFVFLGLLAALVAILGYAAFVNHAGEALFAKLALAVAVVGLMILRSMFIKFDAPEGILIAAADAPDFFATIETIRARLDGPQVDEVYVDGELNAYIQQIPRFGFFGGSINRLVVGLPLMRALTKPQLAAVLAHEYGHLAGAHGKTGTSLYRTRALWARLFAQLEAHHNLLNLPLYYFIRWFAPYFDRLSFPLGRSDEFAADRRAAEIAGAQAIGDSLVRISLAARHLGEKFWPAVRRRAIASPAPDIDPQAAIARAMSAMCGWPENGKWTRAALAEATGFADTHPALKDRLAAVGVEPRPPCSGPAAAAELLGDFAAKAEAELDRKWRELAERDWAQAHAAAREKSRTLRDLDDKAARAPLDRDAALIRGRIAGELMTAKEAARRFLEAVKWRPDHAEAWLHAGCALVALGDRRGLKFLNRAAAAEARFRYAAAFHAFQTHAEAGDGSATVGARKALDQETKHHERAAAEVSTLTSKDALVAHGLDDFTQHAISARLGALEGLKGAWLLRKHAPTLEGYFAYHLVIEPKSRTKFDYNAAAAAFQDLELDAGSHLWFAAPPQKKLKKIAARVVGAQVFGAA